MTLLELIKNIDNYTCKLKLYIINEEGIKVTLFNSRIIDKHNFDRDSYIDLAKYFDTEIIKFDFEGDKINVELQNN